MVKYTGRGLVVKRPGVLSKVQVLNLVLGVGVFSLLPSKTKHMANLPGYHLGPGMGPGRAQDRTQARV